MGSPPTPSRARFASLDFVTHIPEWLVVTLALLLVIIGLWLPFGLNVVGVQEEWRNLAQLESQNVIGDELISRPFLLLGPAAAYLLTPDSFVGYNLVMMALFFGKGLVCWLILRRLQPDRARWALWAAILFVVFPADAGLITMRALPGHAALFFLLLATFFLILYWDTRRVWLLPGMWLALVVSLLTYEVGYPLVAVVPLILVWKERKLSWRVIRCAVLWYLVPVGTLLYAVFLFFFSSASMTRNLFETGTGSLGITDLASGILPSIAYIYENHFVTGWVAGIEALAANGYYAGIAAAVAGTSLVASLLARPEYRDSERSSFRWALATSLIGILIIFLATCLYLLTSRRAISVRVYYYSSIGGALVFSALVWLLCRWLFRRYRRPAFAVLMALLVMIAMGRVLAQHEEYARMGDAEAYIVDSIVRQAPRLTRPATIIFVTPPGEHSIDLNSLDRGRILRSALSYLYEDNANVRLPQYCDSSTPCEFGMDAVAIDGERIPYDAVLIFRSSDYDGLQLLNHIPLWLRSEGGSTTYHPETIIDRNSPQPLRLATMLGPAPLAYEYPTVTFDTFNEFFTAYYKTDQPVILETQQPNCQSESDCQIFDWLSGEVVDVPDNDRFFVTPDMPLDDIRQALNTFLADTDVVWQVQTFNTHPDRTALTTLLRKAGFMPTRTAPWNGQLYPNLISYRRIPDDLQPMFIIGNTFSLQSWALQNDVHVKACQSVAVTSWWSALNAPDRNYSMTLVLANADGLGVSNTDSAPADTLTKLWQPGELYYDERIVTIPCDTSAGKYSLLIGLYDPATTVSLPITTPDGDPVSNLLYLTTLEVGE